MNGKIFNVFIFTIGAVTGSLVTWKFVKTKYEKIAQEEIDSVKETLFERKRKEIEQLEDLKNELKSTIADDVNDDGKSYEEVVTNEGYIADSDEKKEEESTVSEPYVIPPDEFGGTFDYDNVCLTYYEGDNILANDWYEVYDIADTIGLDALDSFGEWEDDVVYVRNDRLKSDYEVCRDLRKFSEVPKLPSAFSEDD